MVVYPPDVSDRPKRRDQSALAGRRRRGASCVRCHHASGTNEGGVWDRSPDAKRALAELIRRRLRVASDRGDFDAAIAISDELASTDESLSTALRGPAERYDAESILATLPEDGESLPAV